MTTDDPFTALTFETTTDSSNMGKVKLHDDSYLNCTANGSGSIDPRCDNPIISLLVPILMTSLGILGNILGLIIIYSSRPRTHSRRTVFFVMLTGLAWSDLIAQACVSPIAILVYANNLEWVGGEHLCRYHGFVMVAFGLVTPLVVCCMSIERLMAIRFSYFYAKHITQKRATITFLLCLLIPFSFSLLPFAGFGSYERQFPGSWCFLNFHRESTLDAIYAGFFSCINISAILVMLICNIFVVVTLFLMRRSRKARNSPSFDRRISMTQISNGCGAVIRSKSHSDMEAQMIWFLCLITIAFSVCWLPFNLHILSNQFTGNKNQPLDLLFIRMVSSNQILDPWLYVIFRKSSFMRLLNHVKRFVYGKRKADDDILNGAIRNEGPRKFRSFFRSSTIEVTTLNRTVGNGHSRVVNNTHAEDNIECLKKILENERKLGREMYSRISERTEYSDSVTQQQDGSVGPAGDRSRHSSMHREHSRYGSVKSRDNNPSDMVTGNTGSTNHVIEEGDSDDSELNEMKYDDIKIVAEKFPVYHNNHHKPCAYTKSCPVTGSDPLILQIQDYNTTSCTQNISSSARPIVGRQLSVPAALSLYSFKEDQIWNTEQRCPSVANISLTNENSSDKISDFFIAPDAGVHPINQRQNVKVLMKTPNFDEMSDYDSNDEVFDSANNMESAILLSSSKNAQPTRAASSDVSDSLSQNLPGSSASDSQGLLS